MAALWPCGGRRGVGAPITRSTAHGPVAAGRSARRHSGSSLESRRQPPQAARMTHTPTPTTTPARKRAAKSAPAKAAAKKAAAPEAAAAPVAKATKAVSTVSKEGEMSCRVCGQTRPLTKFPTTKNAKGDVVRVDRCRSCRDAATAARK
jgi:hypothetical protein